MGIGTGNKVRLSKKGAASDIFLFIVVGFSFALVCVVGFYIVSQVNPLLKSKLGSVGGQNVSINNTLDIWEAGTGSLDYASVGVLFGLVIAVIMSALLTRLHPAFYFLFFLMLVIAIIVSVPISNAYDDVIGKLAVGADFTITSFIMSNLPLFVTVVGVAALVVSFVKMGSGGASEI